jgi:hypothetical protein
MTKGPRSPSQYCVAIDNILVSWYSVEMAEKHTKMGMVPIGACLLSGSELVEIRASRKNRTLIDKRSAILVVGSRLEDAMPVLQRLFSQVA